MWECTGGSALRGEDSLAAAIREVREETGLTLEAETGRVVLRLQRPDAFVDVWLFRREIDLSEVVCQPGETCDARLAAPEEIMKLRDDGSLVRFDYLEQFFAAVEEKA